MEISTYHSGSNTKKNPSVMWLYLYIEIEKEPELEL